MEVHAKPCLGGKGVFKSWDRERRYLLLQELMVRSLPIVTFVHYLGMTKPLIEKAVRQRIEDHGFDPHTYTALNITLMVDRYVAHHGGQFDLYFDKHNMYGPKVKRIVDHLRTEENPGLRLRALKACIMGTQSAMAFIQLGRISIGK